MPDNDEVGNAGHGVPTPLLRSSLIAEGGEQAGEDHDFVSNQSHGDIGAVQTGNKAQIEKEQRSGQGPVNVTSPVNLAVDNFLGIRVVRVLLTLNAFVVRDAVAGSHGEVGHGGKHDNESRDDVVETAALAELSGGVMQSVKQDKNSRPGRSRPWR